MNEFDDVGSTGEATRPEYFEHPEHGWLSFDPNTMAISPNRDGHRPINKPIFLPLKFQKAKQPSIPTCREPGPGEMGCSKWYGCKIGQMYNNVVGNVIMKKHGARSAAKCYDYFETTRGGRTTSQSHYGHDGWELDFSKTTIPVLGRTEAVGAGKLNEESSREKVISSKPRVWEMEIGDLLPPWWRLMKEKGLPLPEAAKQYPKLTEEPRQNRKKSA